MKKSTIITLTIVAVVVLLAVSAYKLLWTVAQPKIKHRISEIGLTSNEIAARFLETYVNPPATLVYESHKPIERDGEEELERYRFTVSFNGQRHTIVGDGNGPLDAVVHALTEELGLAYDIKDYQEHAMEAGSDSSAAAYILAKTPDGTELFGVGQSKSITKASIFGLIAAINRGLQS